MHGKRINKDEELSKVKTSKFAITLFFQIPVEELAVNYTAKKPHYHVSLGLCTKQQEFHKICNHIHIFYKESSKHNFLVYSTLQSVFKFKYYRFKKEDKIHQNSFLFPFSISKILSTSRQSKPQYPRSTCRIKTPNHRSCQSQSSPQ